MHVLRARGKRVTTDLFVVAAPVTTRRFREDPECEFIPQSREETRMNAGRNHVLTEEVPVAHCGDFCTLRLRPKLFLLASVTDPQHE